MANLLAVDDERNWLDLYVARLSEEGHAVRTCEDGVWALREIERNLPELLILDIRMWPTGHEILRAIRKRWPELPVIIYTSHPQYRDDMRLQSASAFLVKSTDLTELAETVERLLGGRKAELHMNSPRL